MSAYTIYKIALKGHPKVYIGASAHYDERIKIHRSCLRSGKHINEELQSAFDDFGEESLRFVIIEDNVNRSKESFWLNIYGEDSVFNVANGFKNDTASDSNFTNLSVFNKTKALIDKHIKENPNPSHKKSGRIHEIVEAGIKALSPHSDRKRKK